MTGEEQELMTTLGRSRLVIAAVLLGTLWAVESVAPMFVGRSRRISHVASNLGMATINGIVGYFFAFAILAITETARSHDFGLVRILGLSGVWAWVVAILAFDCWQYWWHRINHRVAFFWRFHAVHHSDAEMDASSGVRFHTGEMVLSFLVRLAVMPLIGMTVFQLLVYECISLPIILFHHSNMKLPGSVDRVLRLFIVTPWMHYVHHSRWQPETDSNYSSFLSVWDRIFGSFRLREKPEEIKLGLDDWHEKEWRGLPGMLAAPFRKKFSRREKPKE